MTVFRVGLGGWLGFIDAGGLCVRVVGCPAWVAGGRWSVVAEFEPVGSHVWERRMGSSATFGPRVAERVVVIDGVEREQDVEAVRGSVFGP